jgi:hypothetical protein
MTLKTALRLCRPLDRFWIASDAMEDQLERAVPTTNETPDSRRASRVVDSFVRVHEINAIDSATHV